MSKARAFSTNKGQRSGQAPASGRPAKASKGGEDVAFSEDFVRLGGKKGGGGGGGGSSDDEDEEVFDLKGSDLDSDDDDDDDDDDGKGGKDDDDDEVRDCELERYGRTGQEWRRGKERGMKGNIGHGLVPMRLEIRLAHECYLILTMLDPALLCAAQLFAPYSAGLARRARLPAFVLALF